MGKIDLRFDEALVERVRAAGFDPEALAERAFKDAVEAQGSQAALSFVDSARRQAADPVGAEARARQWAKDNAEAIQRHKERIAARGVFGEDLRRW